MDLLTVVHLVRDTERIVRLVCNDTCTYIITSLGLTYLIMQLDNYVLASFIFEP